MNSVIDLLTSLPEVRADTSVEYKDKDVLESWWRNFSQPGVVNVLQEVAARHEEPIIQALA